MKNVFVTAMIALGLICGTAHQASSAMTLKVAHNHQMVSPHHKALLKFKDLVEARSKGELKIEIYDSHRFGMAPAYVQGLKLGTLAMAGDSPGNFSQWAPRLNALDLPFLIEDLRDAEAILTNPIMEEMTAELAKAAGAFYFGFQHTGHRLVFANKPIKTIEDLNGLKIRTTASKVELAYWKRLGASPIPMAWGEVYTALQQKTIDGINIDSPNALWVHFDDVCKYVYKSRLSYYPIVFMFSNVVWKKLTPEQQEIVSRSWAEANTWERLMEMDYEADYEAKMTAQGVTYTEPSPQDIATMKTATAGLDNEFPDLFDAAFAAKLRTVVADDRALRTWW